MRPRCAASVEPDVTCVRRPRGGGGQRVASRARAVKIIYKDDTPVRSIKIYMESDGVESFG